MRFPPSREVLDKRPFRRPQRRKRSPRGFPPRPRAPPRRRKRRATVRRNRNIQAPPTNLKSGKRRASRGESTAPATDKIFMATYFLLFSGRSEFSIFLLRRFYSRIFDVIKSTPIPISAAASSGRSIVQQLTGSPSACRRETYSLLTQAPQRSAPKR